MNHGLDRWMLQDIEHTMLFLQVVMTEAALPAVTVRVLCQLGVAVGA